MPCSQPSINLLGDGITLRSKPPLLLPLHSQAGDKAGANAALKELAASTKLTKYVPSGTIYGSKFLEAGGLPSGETPP